VEDTSVLLVNGPAAVPGVIEASWTTPVGASELVIFGTRGNLAIDYTAGDFGVARVHRAGHTTPTELPRSSHDRFTAEMDVGGGAHAGKRAQQDRPAPARGVGDRGDGLEKRLGARNLEVWR